MSFEREFLSSFRNPEFLLRLLCALIVATGIALTLLSL